MVISGDHSQLNQLESSYWNGRMQQATVQSFFKGNTIYHQSAICEQPAATLAKQFGKRSPEETWLRTRVHEICWNPS